MTMHLRRALTQTMLIGAAFMLGASPLSSQTAAPPVIQGYGNFAPIEGFAVQPDPALRYRVVLGVTTESADPAKVNHALDRVARFVNMIGAAGVHPGPGDIVAIVYSGATPIVTNDATYAALTKVEKNPNLDLIKKLTDAGVVVAVCRQALAGRKIEPTAIAPGVRVDASAITTIATLQLRGWAYIDD